MKAFEMGSLPQQEVIKGKEADLENFLDHFREDEAIGLDSPEIIEKEKENPKVRGIKKVIASITAGMMMFCAVPGCAKNNEGEVKKDGKKIETLKDMQDDAALRFLNDLVDKAPTAKTSAERAVIKQGILDELRYFALKSKDEQSLKGELASGSVSNEDMQQAIGVLDRNTSKFADYKFGNKDGNTEPEEFERMRKDPGMRELQAVQMGEMLKMRKK